MAKPLGLGAILLALAGLLGVAGRVAPCDPHGGDFCGLPRAEDIAFIPGTDWFAVSTASREAPLVFIDARSKRRVALSAPFTAPSGKPARPTGDAGAPAGAGAGAGAGASEGAPDCPGPPPQFRAGGNDIRRVGPGLRMVVINKPEPGAATPVEADRVELFAIEMRGGSPRAQWLGCFPAPPAFALNDVALGADGMLYGSHQFDRPGSPAEAAATRQKWLDGTPTGHGLTWASGPGWTRLPGTEVSFANGIAVARDGRRLAVAGTYSRAIMLVDRRSGTVRRVMLPHTPDNVTPLADGGFLSVGHTGVPVTGVDPCRPPDAVPCGFPFSVARIALDRRGGAPLVTVLFEHDGSRIPGASVAVLHGERLYLGSFFGDRVTVIDRPAGAPRD